MHDGKWSTLLQPNLWLLYCRDCWVAVLKQACITEESTQVHKKWGIDWGSRLPNTPRWSTAFTLSAGTCLPFSLTTALDAAGASKMHKQKMQTLLKLHRYCCLLTIQTICCFCNEVGKRVRYTCGDYHNACSVHIRNKPCAQCKVSGHKLDNTHTGSFAVSEIHWYTTVRTEAQVPILMRYTNTFVNYYTGNLLLLQWNES